MAVSRPGRDSSSGTDLAGTWLHGLAASRSVRNKFLLFQPPACGYLCWSPSNTPTPHSKPQALHSDSWTWTPGGCSADEESHCHMLAPEGHVVKGPAPKIGTCREHPFYLQSPCVARNMSSHHGGICVRGCWGEVSLASFSVDRRKISIRNCTV